MKEKTKSWLTMFVISIMALSVFKLSTSMMVHPALSTGFALFAGVCAGIISVELGFRKKKFSK